MKTITLHVGDKLRALVNNPFDAPIHKGDICEIVDFGRENNYPNSKYYNKAPIVICKKSEYPDSRWYTNVKDLFHKFKKVSK